LECEFYPIYWDKKLAYEDSLVAIMLILLRMNVDEAIDALISVAHSIFPEESQDVNDKERNSKVLKEVIEDLLQARGVPLNAKMYEKDRPEMRCKGFVRFLYGLFPKLRSH